MLSLRLMRGPVSTEPDHVTSARRIDSATLIKIIYISISYCLSDSTFGFGPLVDGLLGSAV